MPQSFKDSGYPSFEDSPILIQAWKSIDNMSHAKQLVNDAEVVIYGNIKNYDWITKRLNKGKLTFECGERWLKRGWINLLSPRLIKSQWLYHTQYYNKPLYRLNASAFASSDMAKLHAFKGKCFKWGYFTTVPDIDIDEVINARNLKKKVSFMVVSRLIPWKHVDMVVDAAKLIRRESFDFDIDIYGSGCERDKIKTMIENYRLTDCVKLCGNVNNAQIHELMRKHDALIFTSDKNEGWGAVVNEAMSNGCPVIGSNAIGSIPYLVKDNFNGLIFESKNIDRLVSQMSKFLQSKKLRHDLARQSYITMKEEWSPRHAASRLLKLIHHIQSHSLLEFTSGPCSPA